MFKIDMDNKKLPDIAKSIDRRVLLDIATQVRDDIITRTKTGKDYNDNNFIPYAKSNKQKSGQTVDLTQSGQMLNALKPRADNNTAQIYISSNKSIQKTAWNAHHKNYERNYFGLSNKNIKYITDQITNILRKIFNR